MKYNKLITEVANYKKQACKMIGNCCGKCEAMFEHDNGKYCCFDNVMRFVEYANKRGLIDETLDGYV